MELFSLGKIKNITPCLNKKMMEKGITQTQLMELSNVPQSALSRFDKQQNHNDLHVFRIAKALNMSVEDLFEITYED